MMKKTVSSILLASALLLGTVAPVAANAAEVTGTTGNTKTQAAFTAPKSVVDPVDPSNPSTPSTGDNGGNGVTNTDTTGGLNFLYVTDSIDFGSAEAVSSGVQPSMPASKISTGSFTDDEQVNPNFVTELSDTRGTSAGWYVTVSSSPMTDTTNSNSNTNTLKGATVDFGTGTEINNSASENGISANAVSVPTETATAQTIYQATADNGAGQTSFQLNPKNIELNNVGPNTNTGTYNGNLTWTLNDTPVEPAK
ncbi:WxL domain-containing protein [Levilactobacillus suantsaiihabitans]|uniref:WxL domain-containing protein n=1 Tax=Levilactobacillus suantsaiihabitans TaxID=2487722 RepID=A0A4Z0JEA7_9LACO|nr:WxL domain-containing protein [Levilactobacillus suantsaiihabitans]TGD19733.1 WxL domain-containing protein [Levilactobacillus suantsaiihabitans]